MRTHTQKIRHGAALPPFATMQGGRCATSPRLIFFWVGCVFYQTIHAAGMKERKDEMDKRAKDFSPLREIGVWMHFLPIDSFPTDRFRPKGLKEKKGETVGFGKTPHGAALRLSVEMRTHPQKNPAWRSLATCRDFCIILTLRACCIDNANHVEHHRRWSSLCVENEVEWKRNESRSWAFIFRISLLWQDKRNILCLFVQKIVHIFA
jgi:hypothetical protein